MPWPMTTVWCWGIKAWYIRAKINLSNPKCWSSQRPHCWLSQLFIQVSEWRSGKRRKREEMKEHRPALFAVFALLFAECIASKHKAYSCRNMKMSFQVFCITPKKRFWKTIQWKTENDQAIDVKLQKKNKRSI